MTQQNNTQNQNNQTLNNLAQMAQGQVKLPKSKNTNTSNQVSQSQQSQQTPDKGASGLLSQLASEDFSRVKRALKFVREGYKLDNGAMQELLFSLKTKYDMPYRDLLAIYLTLDIAVEKGALTNEVLDYLKEHPEEMKIFEEDGGA